MNPQERQDYMAAEFTARFGAPPEVWTRAPGRVDLMGSHTDYNDGFILTMTIDRDTWVAARPRHDGKVCVYSLNAAGGGEFSLGHFVRDEESLWPNYVRGVAQALADAGYPPHGFDGLLHTTVPVASGLSSSAALEMAVGRMFEQVSGWEIDPVTLARLGQRAENHFVGVQTGILDQYTSAMGKEGCAILLDARSVTSVDVPLAPGIHLVICDTRARRSLASSEYGLRRTQCEEGVRVLGAVLPHVRALRDVTLAQLDAHAAALDPVVARRCRFIIEENERVHALAAALANDDRPHIAALCAASFAGARDLYEITVPEMAAMMDAMLSAPGVVAARQAGAGFGGCMMAYVAEGAVDAFAGHVQARYQAATGIEAKVYPVAASAGAGVL